ncbi:MAG: hypothetical protein V3T27_06390 [Alphaproteobacteria bacterium]
MSALVPRLEFEELTPELKEMFRPRLERLGYLGEFFKCMSHQPRTMMGFYTITESLKGALPDNFTQIVCLSVSSRLGNLYEQYQNERLSRKLGFSDAWIREAVTPATDDDSVFGEQERLVQMFAIAAALRYGKGVTEEFENLVKAIGAEQAIGVLWLVGRTVTHALISNALRLEPPVQSLFDGEKDGGGST